MRPPLIMQFIVAFNNDKVIFFLNSSITIIVTYTCIYISHFFFKIPYNFQPSIILNGHQTILRWFYEVRVRQRKDKVYLADGLQSFRKDLKFYESTSINFFACDHHSVFDIHFIPPLERQTCGRQRHSSRKHIWTLQLTQEMLDHPEPLLS